MWKDLLPSILFFAIAVVYGIYKAKRNSQAEQQRLRAEHEASMKFEPLDSDPCFAIAPEPVSPPATEPRPAAVPAVPGREAVSRQAAPKPKDAPMDAIPKVAPEEEARRERWRRAIIDSEILQRKY